MSLPGSSMGARAEIFNLSNIRLITYVLPIPALPQMQIIVFILSFVCRVGSCVADLCTKRKCGADFVYLTEGCSRTCVRINDAIPHT